MSGIFFPATTCSPKRSKLDRSSLIKPVIQNGQLCKFGELISWCLDFSGLSKNIPKKWCRKMPISAYAGVTKRFCLPSQLCPLFRLNFRLKKISEQKFVSKKISRLRRTETLTQKNFAATPHYSVLEISKGQGITSLIYSMFSMHTFLIYFSNVQWHSL